MSTDPSTLKTGQNYPDDVSPDSLMSDFRGRPIIIILAFTVVVHLLLVGVFSIGYLKKEILGEGTAAMSEEQRLDAAVLEATKAFRDIAERHDVSPQELSSRFADTKLRPPSKGDPNPAKKNPPVVDEPAPKEPGSPIEQKLNEKAVGPDLPDLAPEDEEDDLF